MTPTPPLTVTPALKRLVIATEVIAGCAQVWIAAQQPGTQVFNAVMGPVLWWVGWVLYCLIPPFSARQ